MGIYSGILRAVLEWLMCDFAREQVGLLTTTSSGMRTISQQTKCRHWQTTFATRKALLLYVILDPCTLKKKILSLMYMLMQLRPVHTLGFCWYVLLYFTNIFQLLKNCFLKGVLNFSCWLWRAHANPKNNPDLLCRIFRFLTVPPAYYAHLAAFRARFYMEPEMSENQTSKSSNGTNGASVKPLPALKEKVKRVMFYCWQGNHLTTHML